MTSARSHPRQPSPWLSVWLRPGDTIERIVASNPRRHVLLFAVLGAASNFVMNRIDAGWTTELLKWPMIVVIVLYGVIAGVAILYVSGLTLRWAGKIFGGRAPTVELRAVIAWSALPAVAALAICLVALVGLNLVGANVPRSASRSLIVSLQWIGAALSLWSVIMSILMLKCVQHFGFWRAIASTILSLILLSLFVVFPLLIRTFLFQPFNMPSGSFKPTLLVGDYIFVSKFSYGYTRYSLPFSPPLFSGRIFASKPERGDIVAFRLPKDDSTVYVKRVIGLPGDRIQMIKGHLHINGEPVKREQIEDYIETEGTRTTRVKQWRETLPNGVSYPTLDLIDNGFYDNTKEYQVPPGHYFMMGDNRDNSTDSRVESAVGYVPLENLVGRAQVIFLSIDQESSDKRIRFERLGMWIR